MDYPRSRQTIENIMVRLKRDILILSIKKQKLTENALHIIKTLDDNLPEMVERVRTIYEGGLDVEEARLFYDYLRGILEETLGVARLDQVFENDETDMIAHIKNQFVEIIREVKKTIADNSVED